MALTAKAELRKLESRIDLLSAEMADLELKFRQLKRDLSRVFSRVSRDFVVHSEKLDPDTEEK